MLKILSPGQWKLRCYENAKRYKPGHYNLRGKPFYFPDRRSFVFMYREIFETEIYQFPTGNNAPFIIDCGANVGLSAAYFKIKYPNSKVLAFEPDIQIFKFLTGNMAVHNFKDVELINKGLWKEDSVLSFHSEGSDGGRINKPALAGGKGDTHFIEVERLSKYMDREIDLLKMDIEGAEIEVIRECEDKLKNCKNIFVEYHSFSNQPQQLHELLTIFRDHNFRYYLNSPVNLRKRPFTQKTSHLGMDGFVNIFATRL